MSIPSRIYASLVSAWKYASGLLTKAYSWLQNSIFKPIVDFFGNLYKNVVQPVIDKIVGLMGKLFNPIIQLWNKLTGSTVAAFNIGAAKGRASWEGDHPKEQKKKEGNNRKEAKTPEVPLLATNTTDPTAGTLSSGGSSSTGESKIRNITVSVDKLIENFTITTNNLRESAEQVKDVVAQALLSALNDVNLAGA